MNNKADELGELIARNVLANYDDPKKIRDDIDKQVAVASRRMTAKAYAYIQRRLTWATKV